MTDELAKLVIETVSLGLTVVLLVVVSVLLN